MPLSLSITVYSYKNTISFISLQLSEISNSFLTENGDHKPVNYNSSSASSWVNSVAVCRGSDLAASGAGNGFVRLWAVETGALRPLYELPLVNSFSLVMFFSVV